MTGRVPFMAGLMGLFLCFLATLQLFNLRGFADLFSQYDLLAGRFKSYGLFYPFIELGLGLLYLSGLWPLFTYVVLLAVLIIGTAGILKTIRAGASIQCGCIGADFILPIGWVTVFENTIMMGMAVMNIFHFSR